MIGAFMDYDGSMSSTGPIGWRELHQAEKAKSLARLLATLWIRPRSVSSYNKLGCGDTQPPTLMHADAR